MCSIFEFKPGRQPRLQPPFETVSAVALDLHSHPKEPPDLLRKVVCVDLHPPHVTTYFPPSSSVQQTEEFAPHMHERRTRLSMISSSHYHKL